MPKFIRGNLAPYDFEQWTALEIEQFEHTPLLYHEGLKTVEALDHVILVCDRHRLIDNIRD